MLRCASCGAEVSEWAAQCPICDHDAADAEEVSATGDSAQASAALASPVLEPTAVTCQPTESPGDDVAVVAADSKRASRRSWGRRVPVAVAALAVIAATFVGFDVATSNGRVLDGRVLSWTSAGSIVSSAANGSQIRPLPVIPGTGLFAATDSQYLATGTGREIKLEGGAFAGTGKNIPFIGPPGSWRAVDFADHDHALVATEVGTDGGALVEAVAFDGHRSVALGSAQSVAGDPRALGVFAVTSASSQPAPRANTDATPGIESCVERRDADSPPVVLATASQALRDLHDRATTAVLLSILPDPKGDKVAIIVVPADEGPQRGGIVVLSRTGRLLGTAYSSSSGVGRPAWSPDGNSLVYNASSPQYAAVAVWSIGHPPKIRAAPRNTRTSGSTFGNCLWAVRGTEFVCADSNSSLVSPAWLTGRVGRGSLVVTHGPSLPFAWLPNGRD